MVINITDLANLLYQYVKVSTNVRKTSDIKSPFIQTVGDISNAKSQDLKVIYHGYLKAVDPISKSIILCSIEGHEVKKNILILGHVICSVSLPEGSSVTVLAVGDVQSIIEEDSKERVSKHPYFKSELTRESLSPEKISQRRDTILAWLSENRIPCTFDGSTNEILIAESVRLKVPYENASDYICPSRIILKRVKQIVDLSGHKLSKI